MSLFVGVMLETIEPTVLESVFEWWDIRDDTIGVAIALIGFEFYRRAARRKQNRPPED